MSALLLGGNGTEHIRIDASTLNRHGLIAGATGTGKTVTLQVLAEQLSGAGVPVFLADIKGDLSGLSQAGRAHPKITERIDYIAMKEHALKAMPTVFWDVFGNLGHPIRTTISELGPLLLANLLELNETQTGILYACFKEADANGLLMLDIDDLNAMLNWLGENRNELRQDYGNISQSSVGAIRRRLLILEEQGIHHFLGEPALKLTDLIQTDKDGKGIINIFDVTQLMQQSPRLYSTILLWLLSELFEELPEVGDGEKPKFVIFLDEAHLIFDDAPKSLVDKIEQVVRLIRSKGVGVFFITQSPLDIPASVAGQLGLKIQHALRAFTPKDKKSLKAVAESFRPNPSFATEATLPELGIGEALVSSLDHQARPTPVEKTLICPPYSQIGPIDAATRAEQIKTSIHAGKYETAVNRESAYELLTQRAEQKLRADENEQEQLEQSRERERQQKIEARTRSKASKKPPAKKRSNRQSAGEAFVKSITRALGGQIGRRIARGILGSLFKR